jgi:aspartyl-tRNA(Asn)/glutamyl-tRNA(Gln) amidotransferase subunit A
MAAADLCDLGIAELGRRYRGRELSPVDVTTAHLARIERLDKTLNSYVTVTAEQALAGARAAEAAIRSALPGRSPEFPSRTRTSTPRGAS